MNQRLATFTTVKFVLLSFLIFFTFSCTKISETLKDQKPNETALIQQKEEISMSNIRKCASELNLEIVKREDIERYYRFLEIERTINDYKLKKNNKSKEINSRAIIQNTITIPVVVHVLHNGESIGSGYNISTQQIQSQIDVLNEDFRLLNVDFANVPTTFQDVAADININFILANVDPNGNPTNGINRVHSSYTNFTGTTPNVLDAKIKNASTGAVGWDPSKYLNIWVCNLTDVLGYAQFPADFVTSPQTDGVVIATTAFGRTGNIMPDFDKGRTATHEIGHWLNLFHIWGDDCDYYGCGCSGTDFCDDTPNQAGPNFGCPSYPSVSCNNSPYGDMFMNYMDYSYDRCLLMFTQNQKDRMWAMFEIGQPRATFLNSSNPIPPTVPIYRYFSSLYRNHFYTSFPTTPNNYISQGPVWKSFKTAAPGTVPIYRYYSVYYTDHFYTSFPTTPNGYALEGIEFYAYKNYVPGTVPVYRYYSIIYTDHFYTLNPQVEQLSAYNYEGIECYVFPL